MLSALVLYAYCIVVCLFMIRLGIIRVLSSIRIFSSAYYPLSAFSHPRFILHPHFLIRVLSSIRIFLFAFYPPSAFSHPYFLIRHPYPRFIPTQLWTSHRHEHTNISTYTQQFHIDFYPTLLKFLHLGRFTVLTRSKP